MRLRFWKKPKTAPQAIKQQQAHQTVQQQAHQTPEQQMHQQPIAEAQQTTAHALPHHNPAHDILVKFHNLPLQSKNRLLALKEQYRHKQNQKYIPESAKNKLNPSAAEIKAHPEKGLTRIQKFKNFTSNPVQKIPVLRTIWKYSILGPMYENLVKTNWTDTIKRKPTEIIYPIPIVDEKGKKIGFLERRKLIKEAKKEKEEMKKQGINLIIDTKGIVQAEKEKELKAIEKQIENLCKEHNLSSEELELAFQHSLERGVIFKAQEKLAA
ncbi:MAG: hypothetical protein JW703_05115 [Candidatus Diapherotrites archaeon]|nr:hypothetical protein [Candidatus Diapherotrites archaeon]